MEVIITMAGFGRRFLEAGYDRPKYQIIAHGRSLFAWSMLSLRNFTQAGARFTFVVRRADAAAAFISAEARALGMQVGALVELDAPTDGQATSALLAGEALGDRAAPMLIYNIDTFVHPHALPAEGLRGAGWIPCFAAEGDGWSFAAVDEAHRVLEVREKQRISPHATIGLYGFSSFDLFAAHYDAYYRAGGRLEAGERYVAPIYNGLIGADLPVYMHPVSASAVAPLGLPAQVEAFRRAPPEAI